MRVASARTHASVPYCIRLSTRRSLAEYSNNIMIRPIPVPAFFPPSITRRFSMDLLNSDNFYFLTIKEASAPPVVRAYIVRADIAFVSRCVGATTAVTHTHTVTQMCVA